MKKFLFTFFFICFHLPCFSSQKIEKIEFSGLKKQKNSLVKSLISLNKNQKYSKKRALDSVRKLMKTGLFYNVSLKKQKTQTGKIKLKFIFDEKEVIRNIIFKGNQKIKEDDLKEVLKQETYSVFKPALVDESLKEIEMLYQKKSYYLAEVKTKLKKVSKDSLDLIFEIKEGVQVKVRGIEFIGNRKISSSELRSVMLTSPSNLLSFMTGKGAFHHELFQRDLQMISFYYFSKGYIQAQILSSEVSLSADKKDIFISIYIKEDEAFRTGSLEISSQNLFSEKDLLDDLSLKEDHLFSYQSLQADIEFLRKKFGEKGYAYANVQTQTRVWEGEKKVDVLFDIDLGPKVIFGDISIKNNTSTRDNVIRRELRIYPWNLYDEKAKDKSLVNIRRLGFFDDVLIHTKPHLDQMNVMDVEVEVKERKTGSINASAGYSQYYGIGFQGRIDQMNFLGKGQRLGFYVDYNKKQSLFNLNFFEPYFLDTRFGLGFDLFNQKTIYYEYANSSTGFAARFSHLFANNDDLRVYFTSRLEKNEVDLLDEADKEIFDVTSVTGIKNSYVFSLVYNTLNDRYFPSKGMMFKSFFEFAGLFGDLSYQKLGFSYQYYKSFFKRFIWRNNINYGKILPFRKKAIPFNELYLIGGVYSLRGFPTLFVGDRKFSTKTYDQLKGQGVPDERAQYLAQRPYGSKTQFYYNFEILTPLIEASRVYAVLFYDLGDASNQLNLLDLNHSSGLGLRWFSPLGVLRFECGKILRAKKEYRFEKKSVNCEFAIGSAF